MRLVEIDDILDARIEVYRHLKDTNRTRWQGRFIAEGDKLVRRLLRSEHEVESILAGRSFVPMIAAEATCDATVYVVDDALIEQIVGFNFHRGMLACARRPPNPDWRKLVEASRSVAQTIVVCPEIHDPENLGSILRTALVFGAASVWLGPKSADPFARRVLRTSMGAVLRLPVYRSSDLAADLQALAREASFELWATVAERDAAAIGDVTRPRRLAVLLGSEGHGLEGDLTALCRRVTIPMQEGVDSLNVAVAAGIIFYALSRSREASDIPSDS